MCMGSFDGDKIIFDRITSYDLFGASFIKPFTTYFRLKKIVRCS